MGPPEMEEPAALGMARRAPEADHLDGDHPTKNKADASSAQYLAAAAYLNPNISADAQRSASVD